MGGEKSLSLLGVGGGKKASERRVKSVQGLVLSWEQTKECSRQSSGMQDDPQEEKKYYIEGK